MITIGVFDSGVGGLSLANAAKQAFPEARVKFVNDQTHVPYGTKTSSELLKLSLPILTKMQDDGCDVIVVACNTLTTTIIKELRAKLRIPLVAIEPMVKPAASMSKAKIIAVCATPATLKSKRYQELKADYAKGVQVIEPDCANWAELIERHQVNQRQVKETINSVLAQGADVIVLGCTHYHWIEEDIKKLAAGRASVIQPEQAIIRRLGQTLEQLA